MTAMKATSTGPDSTMISVQILLFDDVEELDFVGPWEVFSVANRLRPASISAGLVSSGPPSVRARYGLRVNELESIYSSKRPTVLLIPGGPGRRVFTKDNELIDHVREIHANGSLITSVCTGAFVLAEAGLLNGRSATTHWSALDELRGYPEVTVVARRYVDEGDVVTAAGISAGIDMALHLVRRLVGADVADEVAHRMEYAPRDP
jgi:transcriptional regulator GlxA family with amidase domain